MEADAQALWAHFASSGSGAACSGTPNVPPDDPEEVPSHDELGEVKLTPCGLAAVGSEKEGSADDFWSGDVNEGPAGDDPGEKVGRGTGSGPMPGEKVGPGPAEKSGPLLGEAEGFFGGLVRCRLLAGSGVA